MRIGSNGAGIAARMERRVRSSHTRTSCGLLAFCASKLLAEANMCCRREAMRSPPSGETNVCGLGVSSVFVYERYPMGGMPSMALNSDSFDLRKMDCPAMASSGLVGMYSQRRLDKAGHHLPREIA